MPHPAQDRVKLAFEDLEDRIRISTDQYEVKGLVEKGRRVVVESRGAAKKLARKLQRGLVRFGEDKQKSLKVTGKSTEVSGGVGPAYGSVKRSEMMAPAPEPPKPAGRIRKARFV